MLVPLATLEVTAARADADRTLAALQRLGMAEIFRPDGDAEADSTDDRGMPSRQVTPTVTAGTTPAASLLSGEASDLLTAHEAALIGDLLALASADRQPTSHVNSTRGSPVSDDSLRARLPQIHAQAEALRDRRDALADEAESLPHHLALLRTLVPLVPELSKLDDAELATLGLASIAVVLDDPGGTVLAALRNTLAERLGDSHLMVASTPNDAGRVSAMVVLRRHRLAEIRALLEEELIGQLGVPAGYAGRSLRSTIAAMQERLDDLPAAAEPSSRPSISGGSCSRPSRRTS